MKILKYSIIAFLIFSTFIFSQVTYQGPAPGSVNSGVEVTTDNFISIPQRNESQGQTRINPQMMIDSKQLYYNGDKPVFDNYVYTEDENAHLQSGEVGTSFVLHSFAANNATNWIPPDPSMAVGPNHVVTSVNQEISIWDKAGNLLKNIDGIQWFSQVAPAPEVSGDPQVIYDHYENRWTIVFMGINDAAQQASNLICYSDDDNPLGIWYMYRLPTTTWGDYPHVGYDDQGIYITTNNFSLSGSGLLYVQMRIINKSELYASNAGPLSYTDIWDISLPGGSGDVFSLQPAISYTPGSNTAYFAWNNEGFANFYALYKLTDPINNPVLTGVELPVPNYYSAPPTNQLGGGTPIESLSRMTSVPIVRDGYLYAVHATRNTQFISYSSLKYWICDLSTNAVIEQGEQGAQGFFYLYPSITVDVDHNIAITYSRSADTEYIGAYYSTRLASDPPGELSPSKVMSEGKGNYVSTFNGRNRWGDYLAASLDPATQYNIWLFSEYASRTNQWGTWITEIRMKPYVSVHAFTRTPSIEFGNIEVNFTSNTITAILANYGEQDLVIDDIPTSMGDFSLDNAPTFPVTLSTYDSLSLNFTFSPTVPDSVQEIFLVNSNDPVFTGFTLSGHGYGIYPALDKVMYASSGAQNNGNILSLNTATGEGTNIGPSLFNDIFGLTISPSNNELLGVRSTPSESEILRVNSLGGDAYLLHNLDLGNMVGISFDNTGTLYGALETGEIYSIDLTNGTYSYVSTGFQGIRYSKLIYQPETQPLWGRLVWVIPP
jgi:hypothetical protein